MGAIGCVIHLGKHLDLTKKMALDNMLQSFKTDACPVDRFPFVVSSDSIGETGLKSSGVLAQMYARTSDFLLQHFILQY